MAFRQLRPLQTLHRLVNNLSSPLVATQSRTIITAAAPDPHDDVRHLVTMIPGDGVSPELLRSVHQIFRETGIPVDFEQKFVSEIDFDRSVSVRELVKSVKKNRGVCLKGTTQSPYRTLSDEPLGLNTAIRRQLDLFANVVHIQSVEGVPSRHSALDFVIIREQTEGEYSALEHESVPGVVECLKIVTRAKCVRIAKFAFDYATQTGRHKVTAVHKANIMKLGDGLFLRCCQEVSSLYPHIDFDHLIIDNTCMQMVARPQQFDVMVMPNLYGNIIDNLAAGLVGGAGMVPGESYGADCVLFEQGARHTFQGAIGRGIANPSAYILSASNMLRHLGLKEHGRTLRNAVHRVIALRNVKTRDIGGYATTDEFTFAVIDEYNRLADAAGVL